MKKSSLKIILIIIIMTTIFLFMLLKINKRENKVDIVTTTKKKTSSWYVPSGDKNRINIFMYKIDGSLSFTTEDSKESLIKDKNYKLIGAYNCKLESCEAYGYNTDQGEVVIYDDDYIIYKYYKNLAKNTKMQVAKYNTIDIMSFNGKDYGLAVSNVNSFYSFYDLKEEKFTTDFKYSNILVNETACLKDGNMIAANESEGKYYVVSYKDGNVKKTSEKYLGSFGNDKAVYYYEQQAEVFEADANILTSNFKKIFDQTYDKYAVTSSGNLILKDKKTETFSIYTPDGKRVKTSKEYKEISIILNDYIVVIDKDDYLKIVDIDGNVIEKYIKLDKNVFLPELSGYITYDGKSGIYLKTEDLSSNSYLIYYYIIDTKQKGVIEINL